MKNRPTNIHKAHFIKSIILSNLKRLNFPLKISCVVTYRCNLRCKMCNIWKRPSADDELTISEIDNFFQRADRFPWIGITGGEPFLRADLAEIMDVILLRSRRLSAVNFSTNGQLTDRILNLTHHIRKKDNGMKIVYTISIDGPPFFHDEIRGAQGAWMRAVETFKLLNDIDSVKPQFGFTLSAHNMDKFRETFFALKDAYAPLRFDDMTVNIFQKSSVYYDNEAMEPIDNSKAAVEIKKILEMDKDSLTLNNFLRRRYLKLYLRYIQRNRCPLKCQALSSTCFLDPYGDLFPCSVFNKRLFNIRGMKKDFAEIWNSAEAERLSYECSHYMCPSCWSPCDAYSTIAGSLVEACLV